MSRSDKTRALCTLFVGTKQRLDGILIKRRQQFLLTWKSNNANDRNKILAAAAEANYLLDGWMALIRREDKRIKRMHTTSCQQSVFLNAFDQKSAHSPAGVWLINEYVKGIASYSCMQQSSHRWFLSLFIILL